MQTDITPTTGNNSAQTSSFSLPVRIYYEDTDAGGVVYYANYLRYCERARTEWRRALGFDQGKLLSDTGTCFVVRAVQADYLAPARLDDALNVVTSLTELRAASVSFLQRIYRENNLIFTATVKVVSVNLEKGRPTPWPEPIHTRFHELLNTPL